MRPWWGTSAWRDECGLAPGMSKALGMEERAKTFSGCARVCKDMRRELVYRMCEVEL